MTQYARDRERQIDFYAFGWIVVIAIGLRLHSGVRTLHWRVTWAKAKGEVD